MNNKDLKAVYFVGAGGIGMSALARYFIRRGLVVAGYDKTPTELTARLEKEGALLHYEENVDEIPHVCKNPAHTMVIYTHRDSQSYTSSHCLHDSKWAEYGVHFDGRDLP